MTVFTNGIPSDSAIIRRSESRAESDTYTYTNRYGDSDGNRHSYTNRYGDSDGNRYSNANSNCYGDSNSNSDASPADGDQPFSARDLHRRHGAESDRHCRERCR